MNLVALSARLPLPTLGDDSPRQAIPVLVWDLVVARTLGCAAKQAKLRLDTGKIYRGAVRFTDKGSARLNWKPLSTSPTSSLSAYPESTSLLPAVSTGHDEVQERLTVLLDITADEHVAAIPHQEGNEGARSEARLRLLLAASLVAQVCAYLIFAVRLPRQLSHAA
jgi:hypothetical protein